MLFHRILLILTYLTLALARVYEISLPDHAVPGETIDVTVSAASHIMNWDDFGIIFGLIREEHECDGCVGMELGYISLYGNVTLGNTTYPVQIPDTTTGKYTFVAAVPYLVGISGETGINYFNQSINLVANAKFRV
ncbi:uncharacterized protein IL334_003984 [Kwoniella shivajii]|uniref:Uncharacterized protein n=1 Tax=Kwoniella shivajii TaxID=564305 RepID=A0ABZ1CZN8_9TREE|nr:hypothetical protein IL334_003984 [Kwoniella shivajii]